MADVTELTPDQVALLCRDLLMSAHVTYEDDIDIPWLTVLAFTIVISVIIWELVRTTVIEVVNRIWRLIQYLFRRCCSCSIHRRSTPTTAANEAAHLLQPMEKDHGYFLRHASGSPFYTNMALHKRTTHSQNDHLL